MQYQIAKAIGLNTDQQAAQVYSFSQDENNLFLAVLSLSCDDAFTRGRQLLADLADILYDLEGSTSEKLTSTFNEAKKRLEDVEYEILLAAVSSKTLYLISQGNVSAYLKRGDHLSPLLNESEQLISGFLEPGDRIFLTTNNLKESMGEHLDQFLNVPTDQWQEEVESKINVEGMEGHGLAGMILEFETEQETPAEEQPIITSLEQPADGMSESSKSSLNLRQLVSSLPSFAFKLKSMVPNSRRARLLLAGCLILALVLGVAYQFKSGKDAAKNQQFNVLMQQAKDDYSVAQGLQTLNPVEATNKLNSAKDNLSKALALKPKDQAALDFKKQIDQNASAITQKFESTQFPLFLDLDLVKQGFRANQLTLSSGKLLVLDPNVKTLISIDLAKKSQQILAGKDNLGEATLASINGSLAFVYSKDKGVLNVDIGNKDVKVVTKPDSEWTNIMDVTGFGGNVYLLDSNQIWKYLAGQSGYSDKKPYLTADTKADFAGAKRLQIESSVYVLKQGGQILRFTRGAPDNFSLGGLDKPVNEPKSFFVSSDTDNLYLLDSGNSRLVVLSKTGEYKAQYQGDKLATATDLVVDEKNKKVYLLDGSKIYQMDLR